MLFIWKSDWLIPSWCYTEFLWSSQPDDLQHTSIKQRYRHPMHSKSIYSTQVSGGPGSNREHKATRGRRPCPHRCGEAVGNRLPPQLAHHLPPFKGHLDTCYKEPSQPPSDAEDNGCSARRRAAARGAGAHNAPGPGWRRCRTRGRPGGWGGAAKRCGLPVRPAAQAAEAPGPAPLHNGPGAAGRKERLRKPAPPAAAAGLGA